MIVPSSLDEAAFWDESICLDCGFTAPAQLSTWHDDIDCPECESWRWVPAIWFKDLVSRLDQGELE